MGSGHVPRKRFGQHFLVDHGVIDDIVRAIAPTDDDNLVEIGPGQAALTDALLARIRRMCAVEIDRDLARRLAARYPADRLALIVDDVLRIDLAPLAEHAPLRLVGNLPYNISSPLLIRLIAFRDRVVDQHFMLQKEVVERIVAQPGGSEFGRLSVMMQAYYDVESLFDVPPAAFEPPPKVESAVLRMLPRRDPGLPAPLALEAVITPAFGQRRKMLRNTLLPWLAERGIDAGPIEPTARAEDVPVAVWLDLARAWSARPAPQRPGR
jgi:16S rRNA (adenine1518-N6/adenine1519-N6)-dimethyltransferase